MEFRDKISFVAKCRHVALLRHQLKHHSASCFYSWGVFHMVFVPFFCAIIEQICAQNPGWLTLRMFEQDVIAGRVWLFVCHPLQSRCTDDESFHMRATMVC